MEIKDLLLPREKYAEVSQQYGRAPFTFEVKKDSKVLYYFGANHSNLPDNHQYPVLREYWNNFLEETKNTERIVLVEGILRPLANSEETAIKGSSESGWVTYFAHQENIPVACPDLSAEGFAETITGLDKEAWLLTSMLRWLNQFQRNGESNLLSKICEIVKKRGGVNGIEVTPDKFKELYRKYIGKEFNEGESQNNLIDPNREDTITNKLTRMHSDLREVKIVSEIERYWREGKSIFIAFGSGHLIIQRPALERLLI